MIYQNLYTNFNIFYHADHLKSYNTCH